MVTDEQIEAMVEARLESMGIVPNDELVAAVIDIAWDIATEDWDEDDPDSNAAEADETATGPRGWNDDNDMFSLVAEEG